MERMESVGSSEGTGDDAKRQKLDGGYGLNVNQFVNGRKKEIESLLAVVTNDSLPQGEVSHGNRTFIQMLPRHLRRRAMSHNIKRLPKLLRKRAEDQCSISTHRKKPPSRYHRRRPRNLLKAYIRRQRRYVWLESHIWHAKRFKMNRELWGYQIAEHSNQRSFRASYRDTIRHCVVEDVSYFVCLEMIGTVSDIVEKRLATVTNKSLGPTFAFRDAMRNGNETEVTLYRPNQYPFGCIGPVSFHWKPFPTEDEGKEQILWIWCHPSIWTEVMDVFKSLFDFRLCSPTEEDGEEMDENKNQTMTIGVVTSQKDWEIKKEKLSSSKSYESKEGTVKLNILKDCLNRFRLSGPLSWPTLQRIAKCPRNSILSGNKLNLSHQTGQDSMEETNEPTTIINGIQVDSDPVLLTMDAWNSNGNPPRMLRSGAVIPMNCVDPRLSRPSQKLQIRTKDRPTSFASVSSSRHSMMKSKEFPDSSVSPIWNPAVRQKVLEGKSPDYALNERRSKLCGLLDLTEQRFLFDPNHDSFIPCLIVATDQMGNGFDIIIPGGWGMPFWLSIQYAGARAGGLRESRTRCLEAGCHYFPDDYPDCAAGSKRTNELGNVELDKYKRRPVNRRVDYGRHCIKHPFRFPWAELIHGWNNQLKSVPPAEVPDQYYVLRERRLLRLVNDWIHGRHRQNPQNSESCGLSALLNVHGNALIPISCEIVGRGRIRKYAIIAIPSMSSGDVQSYLTPSSSAKQQPSSASAVLTEFQNLHKPKTSTTQPEEGKEDEEDPDDPLLGDVISLEEPSASETVLNMDELIPDKMARKEERNRTKRIEKRREKRSTLKRRRNDLSAATTAEATTFAAPVPVSAIGLQTDQNVVHTCKRPVAGYVVRGDYTFSSGCARAVGYVSLSSILRRSVRTDDGEAEPVVPEKYRKFLLMRNSTSRYYRLAKIKVVI